MTDERDELLDELRAALAVEPSPEFEARVRMAVAAAAPRGVPWMWAAAGVGIAAIVVAMALRPRATEGGISAGVAAGPMRDGTPTRVVESRPEGLSPERFEPATRRGASARGAAGRLKSTREPEILVPPGQAIALARLIESIRDGHTTLALARWSDGPVVVPPLVEVEPVRVDPLPDPAPADPADASGTDS